MKLRLPNLPNVFCYLSKIGKPSGTSFVQAYNKFSSALNSKAFKGMKPPVETDNMYMSPEKEEKQ